MINRYVIKIDDIENACSFEDACMKKEEFKNQIILNHYFYNDETDKSKGENFLFYESEIFPFNEVLCQLDFDDIDENNFSTVNELPDEALAEFEENCPDVIYITNYPRKFTENNLIDLISALPYSESSSYKPKIEKLPCVFKLFFDESIAHKKWIQSILRFIPLIEFSSDEMIMSAETNCLKVPVIHFLNLPPTINTIEYFIEISNNELGNYKLYEENERKDDQPLSFNVSYSTEEEAWDIIDSLNFRTFEEKEIRVNHFIDKKILQDMTSFNIKVTNYEGEFNSYEIYDKFSKFGSIYSIYKKDLLLDKNSSSDENISKPHNTMNSNPQDDFFCIQYYLKEDAIKAVNNAQNELQMKNLTLTTKGAGLVVYNYKNHITEEAVRKDFPDATKVVIKKSKDINSRPYVFINFICQEDCDKAKDKCKEIYSNHVRLMCVSQTLPKDKAFLERRKEEERCQKKNTIFIQKVPIGSCAEDVIQECAKFGDIDSFVFIDINNKKVQKRIAKISFHSNESFQRAMKSVILLKNTPIKPSKYLPHSH